MHDSTDFPFDHHDDRADQHGGRGHFRGGFPQRGPGGHGPFGGRGFGANFGAGFPGFGGPGFGPRGPRARKGDVRGAVLSLLAEAPSNGYGLIRGITEKTDGVWKPSPGSVYPTLSQLVDEELITQTSDSARSEYVLTDAGRAYVADHADELAAIWDGASAEQGDRGELFGATGKLLGVVRQFATDATPEQRATAVKKLDELRRDLYRTLGE
jgi:DNA-binding PadR family transcriptional regulator